MHSNSARGAAEIRTVRNRKSPMVSPCDGRASWSSGIRRERNRRVSRVDRIISPERTIATSQALMPKIRIRLRVQTSALPPSPPPPPPPPPPKPKPKPKPKPRIHRYKIIRRSRPKPKRRKCSLHAECSIHSPQQSYPRAAPVRPEIEAATPARTPVAAASRRMSSSATYSDGEGDARK